MSDAVKNPKHYTEGRKYEPKDVIRDWGLNFNLGNAVKYITRAGRKEDIIQDLKKARQYIQFEIEAIEGETVKQPHPVDTGIHHPNCRCCVEPMGTEVDSFRAMMDAIMQDEIRSVKPIMVEVPDDADIDDIIKHIIKGLEKAVITAEDHPKNKFEEFNKACLPVLEFLNKYYDPHSYAVITEGRAEIVRGDMGVPLPVRD